MKNLRFTIYDLRLASRNGRRVNDFVARKSHIVNRKFSAVIAAAAEE
jgi:hypothetical protein